ncbi:hypothetical protein JJL56_31670 [Azospirillum sp. YIM DDC1]|uniref:DUF2171 domain-containing protein n=1 Tax=Azospirillum aestuarii TaxID=2802052 RepID=A0ABS1I8L8_9PROT|nr:hypothetical protein [Azospirillum aestuarii]MBK4723412.1 hypothetical protein [Azospirillum aestuarii]
MVYAGDDEDEEGAPVRRVGGWVHIRGLDGRRVCVRSVSAVADADIDGAETVIHASGREIVVAMPLDQVIAVIGGDGGGRSRW